jgi:hypothetical protein
LNFNKNDSKNTVNLFDLDDEKSVELQDEIKKLETIISKNILSSEDVKGKTYIINLNKIISI